MEILKIFILIIIMGMCTSLGLIKSNRFKLRVEDLQEIRKALTIAKTKMRYTYETLPDLFLEISNDLKLNISKIFLKTHKYMKELNAGQAWEKAIDESENNFSKRDLNIIKGLSKLLGQTDLEGQLVQLEVTNKLLEEQIEEADNLKKKNTKLYRTLGATIGLAIMIIFI